MEEIIVTSQAQLDWIPVDYNGRIIIKFGTKSNRAVVNRKFKYPVVARDNSSVVARGNSSVEAWENSSVVAWGKSSVVARGKSSVVAGDNSSVVAGENSSVVARDNSSVEAWENSTVRAKGNVQVVDNSDPHNITISGNARIVYEPKTIHEYITHNELESDGKTVKLFKAVHKRNGKYMADWCDFEYVIGEVAAADSLTTDIYEDCGHGIHMAYKEWCVGFGASWNDLAILELECEVDGIIVPYGNPGKVRAASAKVLREVPLEECGLYGKILAKRRAS